LNIQAEVCLLDSFIEHPSPNRYLVKIKQITFTNRLKDHHNCWIIEVSIQQGCPGLAGLGVWLELKVEQNLTTLY